jgi:hypothetical protein
MDRLPPGWYGPETLLPGEYPTDRLGMERLLPDDDVTEGRPAAVCRVPRRLVADRLGGSEKLLPGDMTAGRLRGGAS